MHRQNLFLVEDNDVIRAGLKHVLSGMNCNVAAEASSLETAEAVLASMPIDIVLLKHRMPDGEGVQFVKRMREKYPGIKVLLLLEEAEHFWDALESDADGYEIRHMPSYQLTTAIQSIRDDYGWLGPVLSRYLLKRGGRERLKSAAKTNPSNERALQDLSPRQREVICLLSQGLRGQQIADQLCISPKTVKLHISACIRKMDVEDRTQAIAKFLRWRQ